MTINKKEFIDRMAEKGGVTKCSCRKYLDLMLETFFEVLSEGISVRFVRLFTAEVSDMKEKETYNIATKKKGILPAHKCMKIRFSKVLQRKFNNAYTGVFEDYEYKDDF